MSTRVQRTARQQDLLLAAVAFIIALVLWQMQGLFFVTYPFRLFVTMIHEFAHGLAAVITGGSFRHFEVTRRGAGLAYTSGGWRFLVIQAGYLGTALFGAALLILTHRTRYPGRTATGLGLFFGILTAAYAGISLAHVGLAEWVIALGVTGAGAYLSLTRDADAREHLPGVALLAAGALLLLAFASGSNGLTVAVGLGTAIVLILLGIFAGRTVQVAALTFLAFLTGLQAITDAWVLLRIVSLPDTMMPLNDARSMAQAVGGTATLWALVWVALDIVIFGAAIYLTFNRSDGTQDRSVVRSR